MPRLTVFRPSRIIILRNLCNAKPRIASQLRDPGFIEEGVTDATAHPQGQAARRQGEEGQQGRSGSRHQHHAHDLRSALDWLKSQGDLIETDKAVDPDLEVTGLQKHMDGGCPVLFNNVKGKPNHRVLTNLFGDMNVINKMFGWKNDAERVRKLAYALRNPLKPVEISQDEAPVPGARRDQAEGRERVHGADPAHHLRAGTDRRLRHPLRHRRRNSMAAPTSATTA